MNRFSFTILLLILMACQRANSSSDGSNPKGDNPKPPATYEAASAGCKPFPYRAKFGKTSYPDMAKFASLRSPERGENQFAYIKANEAFEKEQTAAFSAVYCDTFESVFPSYDTDKSAFVFSLVGEFGSHCNDLRGGQLLGGNNSWGGEPLSDIRLESGAYPTKEWVIPREKAAQVDAAKKQKFRRGAGTCYADRYRVPVRVVYKLMPRDSWRSEFHDGSGKRVPTIKVLYWDAPELELLIRGEQNAQIK